MVKITTIRGETVYLSAENIAQINEGSRWHGYACVIRTSQGQIIEAREEPEGVAKQVERDMRHDH